MFKIPRVFQRRMKAEKIPEEYLKEEKKLKRYPRHPQARTKSRKQTF